MLLGGCAENSTETPTSSTKNGGTPDQGQPVTESAATQATVSAEDAPNVLWIETDEIRPDVVAALSSPKTVDDSATT
jgi:hypothetical protein